jgi:transcriptional antiterminator NusG
MKELRAAFSPDVLAELARPIASYDYRNAELIEGVTPKWYVIETYPHRERDVAAELSARRFGIYLPEEQETIVKLGRVVDRTTLMFPGYVFAFLWDAVSHRSRIEPIDGVQRLLLDVKGVPLFLTDDQIDRIRYCENCARPILLQSFEIQQNVIPKKRKRHRKPKKKTVMVYDEVVAVRAWSAFEDAVMTLDAEGRNQALRNLLELKG